MVGIPDVKSAETRRKYPLVKNDWLDNIYFGINKKGGKFMNDGMCTCEKCGRTKPAIKFYTYKKGGKCELCKDCLTMHIDNFNPETFLWILKDMDLPYIPEEWNVLRDRAFAKNPNLNGMSVFGKYLSKMKLKQFKDYRFKDTEFLQELADSKLEQTMKRQGYGAAEITMAIEKNKIAVPEGGFVEPVYTTPEPEDYFAQ